MKADLVVIGGGPAGMAAALAAYEKGIERILILERDRELGGILNQCIHNGFGLHTFKEELTGPEYAYRYIEQVRKSSIAYELDTMVVDVQGGTSCTVTAMNTKKGMFRIECRAVILAMGCRERARGAMNIPGFRPSGIYSAGPAQRYVNMEGRMPGRKVVILGSGDIGLIMARRMVLQGAEVKLVAEIMPYSGGLRRNIAQCLDDYDIPLMLNHTVTQIHGKDRVEGVTVSRVDEQLNPVPGSQQYVACDTILLSCGLIPENELSRQAGAQMDSMTQGPVVNERLETTVEGIFACGNVLHVHDLVDHVSEEAKKAGEYAAEYLQYGKRDWGKPVVPKIPQKAKNTIPEGFQKHSQVVCIGCPLGCVVTAKKKEDGTLEISGNTCPKGEAYARSEFTSPVRMITSLIRVMDGNHKVVSVKTSAEIPKDKIFACMEEIHHAAASAPVHIGDVLISNVADSGIDIVATSEVEKI